MALTPEQKQSVLREKWKLDKRAYRAKQKARLGELVKNMEPKPTDSFIPTGEQ